MLNQRTEGVQVIYILQELLVIFRVQLITAALEKDGGENLQ